MENRNHYKTFRELCEAVRTVMDSQGFPSKDTKFSLRLVYDAILDSRTSFLKRTKTLRRGVGQENVQTISCVKLEEADRNVCPCQPPTGCTWLKSTKPIPKSLILSNMSVTNSNANFKADFVEWTKFKNKLYSRGRKEYTRYFTILETGDGPYLYLYNDLFLESVSLTGLWEDPNHAAYFTSCGEETKRQEFLRCNPLDTPLYMDRDTTDVVFKMTYDSLIRTVQGSILEIKNDSLDTSGRPINETV
jgi:hypothetical protein